MASVSSSRLHPDGHTSCVLEALRFQDAEMSLGDSLEALQCAPPQPPEWTDRAALFVAALAQQHATRMDQQLLFGTFSGAGFDPEGQRHEHEFPHPKLQQLELGRELGVGRWGRVLIARTRREPHHLCVVKAVSARQLEHYKQFNTVRREVATLSQATHAGIVALLDAFVDRRFVYLVMEYAPRNTLYDSFPEGQGAPEHTVAGWVRQIVEAFRYLSRRRVMHRDLKPENVLVFQGGRVKLADFGSAVRMAKPRERRASLHGTPDYIAPEIVARQAYSQEVDLWSLGVLIYECLTGRVPFSGDSQTIRYAKIVSLDIDPAPHLSAHARDLISKLLVLEPSARLSWAKIERHPFLQQQQQEVKTQS